MLSATLKIAPALVLAVPLLVLFGFYFKNYVLFGEFNVCSFTEKNLWIMTAGNMPWDEKNKLVEEEKISGYYAGGTLYASEARLEPQI